MPSSSDLNLSVQGELVRDQLHLVQAMDAEWMGGREAGQMRGEKHDEIRAHPLLLDFMDAGWMGKNVETQAREAGGKEECQKQEMGRQFDKVIDSVQADGRSLEDVHPMLLQMMDNEWMGSVHRKRVSDKQEPARVVRTNVRKGLSRTVNPLLLDMMDSVWTGSGDQSVYPTPRKEPHAKSVYEIAPFASEDEIQAHYKKFAAEHAFETLERAMDGLWAGPGGENMSLKIAVLPMVSRLRPNERPQLRSAWQVTPELLEMFEDAWYGVGQRKI